MSGRTCAWCGTPNGLHVSRLPRGEDGSRDFHALLRHRLLREACGFEGLGSIRELLPAHHLAVFDGVDLEEPALDLYPAAPTAPAKEDRFDQVIAGVDENSRSKSSRSVSALASGKSCDACDS